ncbi:hypothetical protein [Halomonas sp. CKK8]|uniref:hypothetical protein n=1 Tax=Halomonas sp. CKK8 TaxID=3036127 RepID=UPI00241562BA|nr:hypothetical protein [Halomonas sp. CKK8]WFM72927.1 hypothetical protein P8934_08015 [Halomonas sp. CKK8]
MFGLSKKPKAETTAFSDFMRTASSREKKRVYGKVLTKAIERQNDVMKRVEVERQHC